MAINCKWDLNNMKNNLFKKVLLLLTLGVFINSCQNEDFNSLNESNSDSTVSSEISFESINFNENGKLKLEFAKALSKALTVNKELRKIIKEEALKKFDQDFDVMYHLVKNKNIVPTSYQGKKIGSYSQDLINLSTNAQTFRDAIIPFFENEEKLKEIEAKIPLLTIFVPELPNNSFSASSWDVNDEQQIPDVAIRTNNIEDIPVVGRDGFNFVLNSEIIPSWPIIVIKENERMVVKRNTENVTSKSNFYSTDYSFDFLDNVYPWDNGMYVNLPVLNDLPFFLKESYNIWENFLPGGWQRDYIYYGLTPTILSGGINGKYREYITSFKMSGDANSAYRKISGVQDPKQVSNYRINTSSGWTDGNYEFRVYCYFGAKSSNNGASDTKTFYANPSDLFELSYTEYTTGTWFWRKTYFKTDIIATKKINLLDPKFSKVQFETWDLNRFANEWKFEFEEVDIPTEITKSESFSQKYNANFSIEPSTGILKKIGLKFGASYEQTQSNSYVMKWTEQSNNLSQAIIPFYDNVVNKNNYGKIYVRSYSTGAIEFEIQPIQVQ